MNHSPMTALLAVDVVNVLVTIMRKYVYALAEVEYDVVARVLVPHSCVLVLLTIVGTAIGTNGAVPGTAAPTAYCRGYQTVPSTDPTM